METQLKSMQQARADAEHRLNTETEARISAQENLRIYADQLAEAGKASGTACRCKNRGLEKTHRRSRSTRHAQKQINLLTAGIAQAQQDLQQQSIARIAAEEKLKEEMDARLQAEEKAQIEDQRRAEVEEELRVQKELTAEMAAPVAAEETKTTPAGRQIPFEIREIPAKPSTVRQESPQPPLEAPDNDIRRQADKLVCDCCGRDDLAEGELRRIDSGHFFCPDCIAGRRK